MAVHPDTNEQIEEQISNAENPVEHDKLLRRRWQPPFVTVMPSTYDAVAWLFISLFNESDKSRAETLLNAIKRLEGDDRVMLEILKQ